MPSEIASTSSISPLGRLKSVALREIWPGEALQFTPWLARSENLALLGESLGMQLVAERTEAAVGGFSADILARNLADNSVVVIENQLEQTDHTHLGQILTYLTGLDAKTVIWIAKRIRDEHRAAVEWLNTNTPELFRFFAIELELWRIAESPPAPRFNLVVKPNDWLKAERAQQMQSSPEALEYFAFWSGLKEWMQAHASTVSTDRAGRGTNIWMPVAGTPLVLSLFRAKGRVGLFVRPLASKTEAAGIEALNLLEQLRPVLIDRLGTVDGPVTGPELQRSMACKPEERDQWPSVFGWLTRQAEQYTVALKEAVASM